MAYRSLTAAQRVLISIAGFRNIGINSSGYLTATVDPAFTYNNWSGGAAFDADTNNDGIANGIAWVLGAASPSASATGLLPTFDTTTDPAYFTYTYRRSDTANAAIGNTIVAQYGTTPSAWTTAIHDGTNIIITVTNDIAPGLDSVQVKIKRTLTPGGTIFARLRVQLGP